MLSKNVRAWPVRDIEAWLATRPATAKVVNVEKAQKTRLQRKSRHAAIEAATTT